MMGYKVYRKQSLAKNKAWALADVLLKKKKIKWMQTNLNNDIPPALFRSDRQSSDGEKGTKLRREP